MAMKLPSGDAKALLTAAQAAVENATTDAEMLAAYQAVHAAADDYVTVLMANGGTAADVETATVERESAMNMAASLEAKMTAEEMAMTAEEGAMKAIMDAKAALTAAQAAVEDATTDAEMLDAYQAVHAAAADYVRALEANDGSAAEIQSAVETQVTAGNMVTTLMAQIRTDKEAAEQTARDAENAKSLAVAQAIVGGKHKATSDAMPGPEFILDDTDIKRKTGDADISLNQSTFAAGRKPFMETDADIDSTWAGKEFHYAASNGKTKEMGAVFTDIEVNGDALYEEFVSGDGPFPFVSEDGPDDTTGAIDLDLDSDPIDAENLASSVVPSAPAADDEVTEREIAAEATRSGSYYGVPGKYTCGSVACTLSRDSDGKVLVASGTLTFAPTLPTDAEEKREALEALMVEDVVLDTDFLRFGYWMKSTKQANGTYKHEIETFSGGAMLYDSNRIMDVKGTAEYLGTAAGIYVNKSDFDSDGEAHTVRHGMFTADANLEAHFGDTEDGAIAVSDQFSISGSVTNFSDSGTDPRMDACVGESRPGHTRRRWRDH